MSTSPTRRGVQLTRYPPGLISALEKLQDDHAVDALRDRRRPRTSGSRSRSTTRRARSRLQVQPPVRHAPAARRPHPRARRRCELTRTDRSWHSSDGIVAVAAIALGAGRASRLRGRWRHEAATTKHDDHDHGGDHHDGGRRRSRRSPACPTRAARASRGPRSSVKIDNTPAARPQAGLDQADVVYEEVVEGGITRLVAIFNSQVPDVVGPVRSVRRTDQTSCGRSAAIFAYSGGAPVNVDAHQRRAGARASTRTRAGSAMVRDEPSQPPRDAPHNLYAPRPALFAVGGEPVPPPPLFPYRAAGAPAVTGARRARHARRVRRRLRRRRCDVGRARTGTWKRSIDGEPAMVTRRRRADRAEERRGAVRARTPAGRVRPRRRPSARATSWVFTDGTVSTGTWVRPDKTQPAQLRRRARASRSCCARARPGSSCCRPAAPST